MRIILLMCDECIVGRELMLQMGANGIPIDAIIVERSDRANREKDYLKNDEYNPPSFEELITRYPTEVVFVPNLNKDESAAHIARLAPDVMLLDGSAIIKPRIYEMATQGAINSHPGLLPEYRGVDSVRWAIFYAFPVGATCHFVDNGLDTGPILVRREVTYEIGETILQIRVRVMRVCAEIVVEAVRGLMDGSVVPKKQPVEGGYFSWAPEEVKHAVDRYLATGIR